MPTWDPPPVVIGRSVTVQDDFEPFHDDPRTDLLTASLGFSRGRKDAHRHGHPPTAHQPQQPELVVRVRGEAPRH